MRTSHLFSVNSILYFFFSHCYLNLIPYCVFKMEESLEVDCTWPRTAIFMFASFAKRHSETNTIFLFGGFLITEQFISSEFLADKHQMNE